MCQAHTQHDAINYLLIRGEAMSKLGSAKQALGFQAAVQKLPTFAKILKSFRPHLPHPLIVVLGMVVLDGLRDSDPHLWRNGRNERRAEETPTPKTTHLIILNIGALDIPLELRRHWNREPTIGHPKESTLGQGRHLGIIVQGLQP